ncbi:hypothetical protein, conserved [Plasmodium gonderi]|uniref:Uncharacterized protein n=1 Tax=Plasmodium gonderi TaxID=77519 RepID=A0A1Y1JU15_PLAGO|nr:hypothetical protein, conserved [Plasmodium gonderi]GAW83394.1 hypothetical protein, conserved [Plasmodium gonderi]
MSSPAFVMAPNLIPSNKYNEIIRENGNNVKMSNRDIYEYSNNKLNPVLYRTTTTLKSHQPVYKERVIYNPHVISPCQVIPNYNPPTTNSRKASCMNSFQCLNGNTNGTTHGSIFSHASSSGYLNGPNLDHTIGYTNKRFSKKLSKVPCLFNSKPTFFPDGCKKMQSDLSGASISFDSPVQSIKGYIRLDTQGDIGNYANNEKKKNKEIEVMTKGNHVEPFKKRITKEKLPEPEIKNKINELIKEKDKQINALEIDIQNEKRRNEMMMESSEAEKERDYSNLDNIKLKEKLLDQKIKYEETLKHLKKVELEKRSLKSSLNVRDKVLTKLENEIGSVDNENDFLLRLQENTSLNDIHNIFKFLQHRDKGVMEENYGKFENRDGVKNEKGKQLNKTNDTKNRHTGKNKEEEFSWYKSRSSCEEEGLLANDDMSNEDTGISYKKGKKSLHNLHLSCDNNDIYSLKSTIVELEKEVLELKEENKNVNFKYENTFQTLSELRKDTLEYMETIVSRDMRIAYMESALQKNEKDITKLKDNLKKQQLLYREKVDKFTSEINILEEQSSHLQSMIQEKDSEIVLLKNEIVRNEMLVKQYEDRNKELQNELRLMCNNLENVIDASNKKDLFMIELEKQLRENEVHRQNAYLKEVAKNRKIHANMKFKEVLYDKSAKHQVDELQNLKKELYLNKIQMQKARDAFEVLKNVPKAQALCKIKKNLTQQNGINIVHNFSECKNDQDDDNALLEKKLSPDTGGERKAKISIVKKKKRGNKINVQEISQEHTQESTKDGVQVTA